MAQIPVWSVWLTLAALLIVAEIFTGTFFLFCFGLGGVAASYLAFLEYGFGWQVGAFAVVSGAAVAFARKFADKYTGSSTRKAGVDAMVDLQGVVIEAIDSAQGTGRIRVSHEEWRALSQNQESIPINTRVRVLGAQGTHLIVCQESEENHVNQ